MSNSPLDAVLRRLRLMADAPGLDRPADAELLARFLERRDESAFELLVWRHGTMVLALCRRLLRHEQDAEDAFQAAFLALARQAQALRRREAVGAWLHRAAFRIALKAKARAARRAAAPLPGEEELGAAPPPESGELGGLLDEEVARLPRKYRAAFVLCHLQGRSLAEAGRELGCPAGTVASRLNWAKRRLRDRLTRRGVAVAVAVALEPLLPAPAAALPPELVAAVVTAAPIAAWGNLAASGAVSAPVVALTEGAVETMVTLKVKVAAVTLLTLGLLGGGAGFAMFQNPPPKSAARPDPKAPPAAEPPVASGTAVLATVPQESTAETAAPRPKALRHMEIRELLAKSADLDKGLEGVPLREALEYLSDRYNLPTILVDDKSFQNDGVQQVQEQQVRLPKITGVRLEQILRQLLAQVDGTYLIRGDHIEVTTPLRAGQILLERQSLTATDQPLGDVLKELTEKTGANIILDARQKDKLKQPVTAVLQSVPLHTVVRLLADQADLAVFAVDNVLYVTSRENVTKMEMSWPQVPELTGPPKS